MPDEVKQIKGIDVSVYQGKPDWKAVAASGEVDFVYVRALADANSAHVDGSFVYNWTNLKSVKLIRGAYFFYHGGLDPVAQAENFFKVVGPLDDADMPPMVDVEVPRGTMSGAEFARRLRKFMVRAEELFGRKIVIYTGGPIFDADTQGADSEDIKYFSERDLWLAAYVNDPSKYIPKTWSGVAKTWLIWQKSGDVSAGGKPGLKVTGISGVVDGDITHLGSIDELKAWIASSVIKAEPVPVVTPPVSSEAPVETTAVKPVVEPVADTYRMVEGTTDAKQDKTIVLREDQRPTSVLGFVMLFIQFLMTLLGKKK